MRKNYSSSLILAAIFLITGCNIFAQIPAYIPTSGLVGWWPFSGNANDESGNGYHLLNTNVAFQNDRNNNPNSAAYFSGNNSQLISQSTFSQLTSSPLQTYSFWFKNVSSNWRFIVNYANSSTTRISMLPNTLASTKSFAVIGSSGCLNCGASGGGYDFPTPGIETGWHHFVVAVSASTYSVYKDGDLVGTQPHTGFNCVDASFRFILGNDIVCAPEFYEMFLDDIAVWNRTLSSSEITALYTTTPASTISASISTTNSTICAGQSTTLTATSTSSGTPCASTGLPSSLTTGLVGYWPFCGNANDASGNGNNGTTMNGVALTTDRFGNSNSAYSFDGVDDYIDLGSYILNSPQEYTIDLWAKFNNSTFSYLFGQATNGEIQIQLDGSGNIKSWTKLTNGGNVSAGTSIPDYSNWHHVTAIFNNNTKILQFIIDGNVYSTTIPNGVNIQSFAGPALFGRQSNVNANFFNGLLDDVKIYNRALTLSEVQDLNNLSTTTYSWSPGGATTPSITVSPTTTTTYTCTVTDANGNSCSQDQLITVNPTPTVNAGVDQNICNGSTATLTATGASTYSWTNSVQNGVAFTPSATTTYTVTGTDANGCTGTDAVTVTLVPTPTISVTNTTICAGQSTTMTAATTSTPSACPTVSGTLNSGLVGFWPFCGNANDASGNGNNGTVNGATLTTDRFGNTNSAYSFDGTSNYISANRNYMADFSLSAWYYTSNGNIQYNPIIDAFDANWELHLKNSFLDYISFTSSVIYQEFLSNQASTLNTWHHVVCIMSQNIMKLYVDGLFSIQYTVNPLQVSGGVYNFGASFTGSDQFFNGKLDDIGIWNRTLTTTEIQQLYTQGQTTYSWSPGGATTPSITVSPTTTTTYTCTVTDPSGTSCTATQTITVNSTPTVNAGVDQAVCNGSTATLTATGASTYSWTNSVQNGVAFTPIATTTYTVTGTEANGCTGTDAVTVTLVPTPTISATNTSVCAGQSTTMTAATTSTPSACPTLSGTLNSGLVGFWPFCGNANDESGNGNNGTVNGATLTTDRFGNTNSAYSFDGNDLIQITNWDEVNGNTPFSLNFWVRAVPYSGWIVAFGTSQNGQGFSCGNWHWGANQFGAQFWLYNYVSATQTNLPDYGWNLLTITYESNVLKTFKNGLLIHTQTVNYIQPNISTGVLNFGKQLDFNEYFTGDLDDIGFWNRALTTSEIQQLYNQGQTTYSWSPGGATTPSITVSPTTTTTYTCTVTDPSGTSCTATQTITVNPTPTVNAGVDQNICNGSTATLTATGASTYSWTNSVQNGVAFTPIATTTYTVTGTDANGCTGTDAVTVTLVPTPTISATNASVCAGQSTTLTASTTSGTSNCPSLAGSLTTGLVGYWPFCGNANDVSGNGNNGTVNGATLTTDRFGNANSAYSFNGSNSIDIGTNGFATGNSQVTLSGWVYITTNPAGVSYIVGYGNPNLEGSVFATGIYGSAGLFGTFSGAVYDAISNINCPLNSWNLVTTVKESNGTIKIYLNANLIYTQTVSTPLLSNLSGRIGRAVWNSSEYWNGKIDDVAVWNRALTATEILALYNTGQATYSWSPGGATTPSITVSPSATTTYTCTVTDINGNSCSATQTITVIPFTGVSAGLDQTICTGGNATLTATGATTYAWNNGVQNGVSFSPVATSSYIVTGTQNGCTATDTVLVTVVADPSTTNPVAASYCQNGGTVTPLTVTASGGISSAYSYQWYANTSTNNFGGTAVNGATTATYTPPISAVGTVYYYCSISQGTVTSGCLVTSGANGITVAASPAITSQPLATQSGCLGATLSNLSISSTGGLGSATYQWYTNTVANTTSGTAISGATSNTYAPPNSIVGSNYYYCVVSYPGATSCATQTSAIAAVNLINDPAFNIPPLASQTICVGGTIPALTFTTNGGSGTPSYQWYTVNGSNYTTILGATAPSYTPPIFNSAGTFSYAVNVTQSMAGCATGFSPLATVTVVADPTVSSPSAANYCQGGTVNNPLSVTATGGINSGYSYQWFSNGSNNNASGTMITGATNATYAPATTALGTLYYYCQVSQGAGCATSSATAAINVVSGPAITSQPLGTQTVCVGATLNAFNVSYSGGTGTPSYQWYVNTNNSNTNGTPIAGAINASYTPGANAVGQNYYYCVISFLALTGCSSVSSNPGTINVIANPSFSVAPLATQSICQGANAQVLSFTTTGGSGTASYQWYNVVNSNYTPIVGANGLTYTPPSNLPVGTYNYAVAMTQIASGCSTGFSSNAQLVVLAQPVVSTPIGGVYCQGGNVSSPLSVSVSGGNGSSNYQWYQNTVNSNSGGTAIAQANANSFTPSLSNFGTLYYYCMVTQNAGCAASSAIATVVSNPSPVISTQPIANQTVCVGSSPAPLTTSYTGGVGTPGYQWYVNTQNSTLGGTPIAGANTNAYVPSNQIGLGSNYYYCVITLSNSSCPQATTNVAAVNTVANPSTSGPTSTTYCQSTTAAQPLSISASGGNGSSYSYQWYSNVNNANFGGSPISGATNASYTPSISGATGYYYCEVSQPGGCLSASAVAEVTIVPAPSIATQPIVGQTLCIGGTPQLLSINTIGGLNNPSYQWYSNSINTITNANLITNATGSSFAPTAATATGTTYYFCQVTYAANSACPTLTSDAATISVSSDPLLSNPTSASYCQNYTTVSPLSITANGGINAPYSYQWFSNSNNSTTGGTPITGATTSSYLPTVNQIGTTYYYCEVSQGSGCNTTSTPASIAVGVAATINQQPTASQSLCLGSASTTLTVVVSAGNYALSYQWYSNVNNSTTGGSTIVGATNAFYTPPSNVLGTKYYYCVVTVAGGGCGNLSSNTAEVNVVSAPSMFQPNNQTVCCQSNTAPISFVGNANNYSWTASGSSALLTGFNTNGTGDIAALTLTNNSSTPQNVTYMVTPSNQGCNGTPVQFSINVMPCLSVNVPSDQYYCAGETVPSFVFSGVAQTYSWVNSNTSVGLQNAGINFVPNFVAQNTSGTTQVATISVTPNFMGCAGVTQSYTIAIYPLPVVDAGLDQELCIGGSVTLNASGAPILVWDNGIQDGLAFVPNSTTTYTVTGTDNNGCQSSDAVLVIVNNPTSTTLNVNACDTYTLNGQTYTSSGTYTQLLSNSNGCDSTITLNLTLNYSPSQPNIYVQNQVNLSTDLVPGLTYQWITCSDLTPISGQTAITYNPTANGVYAVVVTNGCGSDTSLCTSITTIGLDELNLAQILLYPNPNNGEFTLEIPEALIGKNAIIYDMQGRLLDQIELGAKVNLIEVNNYARGAYWLQIDQEQRLKWMKN